MALVRSPAFGLLHVVKSAQEIPKGNTLPVFWQQEVDELRRGNAPREVWEAVILVKQVMGGALVSRYYSAEDIAQHYRRLKGSLAWGRPPLLPKKKRERMMAIPLDADEEED